MKIPVGIKYVIGIDEAGRGPLAGPVSVGVCVVPVTLTRKLLLQRVAKLKKSELRKLRDSKKLSEKQREAWFLQMQEMQKKKDLNFSVTLVSNQIIDQRGIYFAIREAMKRSLGKLKIEPAHAMVLLDGGLRAPAEFIHQKTIIKGDEKEFAISLASIAAKVTRDRYMQKMAKIHPLYGFEWHKGYGTKRHIASIKAFGVSCLHRASFLKRIV